ncbi:MAG: phospho-N-acetylmuramoyl-pentapeptide-transferase, partial [Oscillospiraceae bacterium]|nr:phospho-N-acetylmuramoyl-pentapeptide-transferase [Oscillospiraceae bacterium]
VAAVFGFFQVSLFGCAVAGGCLGFLIYNFYPAKVFMGDTGSMFLGGCVVAMAFGIGMPLMLAFTGFIYICESMSVVLQVISFKTTGKRIFKMSPIHHHFEMSGYSEVQIVIAFSLITLAGAGLAFWAAYCI